MLRPALPAALGALALSLSGVLGVAAQHNSSAHPRLTHVDRVVATTSRVPVAARAVRRVAAAARTAGRERWEQTGELQGGTFNREDRLASPARQTADQAALLRVPNSAFAPGVVDPRYDGVESAAIADQNWFAQTHTKSYSALGFVIGYYERANLSSGVVLRYQGGIFSSTDAAAAAMKDGVAHTKTLTTTAPFDCSGASGAACSIIAYPAANGDIITYAVIQYNQCVLATSMDMPRAAYDDKTLLQQDETVQQNVAGAALTLANTVCGPGGLPAVTPGLSPVPTAGVEPTTTPATTTSFKIDRVTVASNKRGTHVLHRIKAGKPFYLVIAWTLTSAPAGARPTYDLRVKAGTRTVFHRHLAGTLSDYPPDRYWVYEQVSAPSPGTYTFTGKVAMSGQTKSGKATITVTK